MIDKIKVSVMSGKMKDIPAINTNPLSNAFCQKMHNSKTKDIVCKECYSCAMLKAYRKNCVPAFERNTEILQDKISTEQIPSFKKNDIVRIHAHGELINEKHMENFIDIANKNDKITFSIYTKRMDIVNDVLAKSIKPKNMIIVYSNPMVDKPITKVPNNFDKVFNVCRTAHLDKINCGAKSCNTCRSCYTKTGANIIYEKIK